MSRRQAQGNWRIFRWPLLIAAASGIGLTAALIGNGWYDLLSWTMLGSALLVMIMAWTRGARG